MGLFFIFLYRFNYLRKLFSICEFWENLDFLQKLKHLPLIFVIFHLGLGKLCLGYLRQLRIWSANYTHFVSSHLIGIFELSYILLSVKKLMKFKQRVLKFRRFVSFLKAETLVDWQHVLRDGDVGEHPLPHLLLQSFAEGSHDAGSDIN